jgi:hypothetical protein
VDLDEGELMRTAMTISSATYGSVRYSDARQMEMDSYLRMIDEFNAMMKERKSGA